MSHKANKSFFESKRPWSKRKDVILAYYLEPYLAKVRRLGRPILLVDGFAGPGKFKDAEIGSPLIFCAKTRACLGRPGPPIELWCIEEHPDLLEELKKNLAAFEFAQARAGTFLQHVPAITIAASTRTLFLYVDPFVAGDVDWQAILGIIRSSRASGASVELLLNFNTPSFVRWALALLKRPVPAVDQETEDPDDADIPPEELPAEEMLSRIVGGTWWREVIATSRPFPELIRSVADRLGQSFRAEFSEVCSVGIKHCLSHSVPKYHMIFGAGHPDALELMNDAMVKARGGSDFETDIFAENELQEIVLNLASVWIPRGALIHAIIQKTPTRYYRRDIRGCVESLLRSGELESESGKLRMNDDCRIKRAKD